MKKFKCILFTFVLAYSLAAVVVVHAQDDQSGFISLDCGLPEGSSYTDDVTGINYISDAGFITSGENKSVSSNSLQKQFSTVRSFPQGTRNCYTLKPSQGKGSKWLIRASFMYGNYDNQNEPPKFNITIGVDTWDTISFAHASTPFTTEIIHTSSSDYIHVCLVKTGLEITPFISILELRPLNSTSEMYGTVYGSLVRFRRRYFDSSRTETIRYNDDELDRIWTPFKLSNTMTISTLSDVERNFFQLPSAVMRTASMADNVTNSIYYSWDADDVTDQFYIAMHFAEVQDLSSNELRAFEIYLNEELWCEDGFVPVYLKTTTCYSLKPKTGFSKYELSIIKTENSTLPPIINALESYKVKQFSNLETNENDVDAIISIKSIYKVTSDWQGDPCEPEAFVWEGLNCSYKDLEPARIISLDLSNSGLTGVIAPSISNLTKLTSLDLSNNNLIGQVPDFLSQLTSLSVLNLKGNNFTGPVPALLLEKSRNGLLSLSFDDPDNTTNTNPCQSTPCKKKKSKTVLPMVISVVAAVVFLAAMSLGIWMIRRGRKQQESTKKEGETQRKDRQFTYSEVLNITNNFQRVLGKGGFGTVYHGYVGDTQVAVKMLSPSSTQGHKEFQAEASLVMSVHHKNLCSLVGYCNEGTNMGIIYEYMANGNLDEHLSGRRSGNILLGWEERLRIAIDAAQGLEYLHHGCKPPIIHRDVKTSNILLTETFQAKLADFGLSRACPVEGGTHVSTVVAGTPGYLDPDCYTSTRLTEKSDVYSFGIVLLEMITGQPPISRNREDKTSNIVQWVDSFVRNGDVKQVVDSRFRGDFNVNSVWKAVELAMTCASRNSAKRPTMNSVVMELKECFRVQYSNNSYGVVASMNMECDVAPLAR